MAALTAVITTMGRFSWNRIVAPTTLSRLSFLARCLTRFNVGRDANIRCRHVQQHGSIAGDLIGRKRALYRPPDVVLTPGHAHHSSVDFPTQHGNGHGVQHGNGHGVPWNVKKKISSFWRGMSGLTGPLSSSSGPRRERQRPRNRCSAPAVTSRHQSASRRADFSRVEAARDRACSAIWGRRDRDVSAANAGPRAARRAGAMASA
jgi:hypothetical protein